MPKTSSQILTKHQKELLTQLLDGFRQSIFDDKSVFPIY
jgi:hypothetical protein